MAQARKKDSRIRMPDGTTARKEQPKGGALKTSNYI